MQGLCEGVEHHLLSSDSCPAFREIRALCSSKLIPLCTAVRAESGGLLTEASEVKACWAGYFLAAVELDVRGVTIPIADPPINCDPPLFVETQTAVNQLKWCEAPGICGIHAELLKIFSN